jgi:O-antigen/teichoic acid export membrane protein
VTLLSSNVLGAMAGGVFFLVASRSFELDEMGRYGMAIGIQWVMVGLLGSGLSVAVIRLAADALASDDRPDAFGIVIGGIGIAAGVSLVVAALGVTVGHLAPDAPFGLGGTTLGWVALWGGGRSMLDCVRSGLLVERRYDRAAVLMVLSAVTGLTTLLVVSLGGPLDLRRMLIAHAVGLGTAAVIGVALLRPMASSGVRFGWSRVRALLAYARWPSVSEGARMVQTNLGPFLLAGMVGESAAGLFVLGRYPAYVFEVVAVGLYQYWLPEAARQRGQDRLSRFLGIQVRLAAMVGAGMIVGAVAARPLLPWLAPNFAAAGLLFVINTVDFALFLLARPIESVFHGMHRPGLEFVLRVARLPPLVALAWWWIAPYGATGMAWAYVGSGAATLAVAVGLVRSLLRRERAAPAGPPDPSR